MEYKEFLDICKELAPTELNHIVRKHAYGVWEYFSNYRLDKEKYHEQKHVLEVKWETGGFLLG